MRVYAINVVAILSFIGGLFGINNNVEIFGWDIRETITLNYTNIDYIESEIKDDKKVSVTLKFFNYSNEKRKIYVSFEEGSNVTDNKVIIGPNNGFEKTFTFDKSIGTPIFVVVWFDSTAYKYLLNPKIFE